jgi:hypothetical protein
VLRPGGTLFITTPNHNWVRKVFYSIPDRMEHHVGLLHRDALCAMLTEAGLGIEDAWCYLHGLIPLRLPAWFGPETAVVAKKPGG